MKGTITVFTFLLSIVFSSTTYAQSKNAFLKAANESYNRSDYGTASVYFERVLTYDQSEIESHYKLADCYKRLNNYLQAEKHYEYVVNSEEILKYKLSVYYLAEIKKYKGEYEKSIALFKQFQKTEADSSTYFYKKSENEIASCTWANMQLYPNGLKVKPLPGKINTPYTEFAPFYINDSILSYSSLSFDGEKLPEQSPTIKISKILRSMNGSRGWRSGRALKTTFNRNNSHNCNATISADGKLMLFTRCNYNAKYKLECKLYESALVNRKWQAPKKIDSKLNKRGFTSTHPSIANAGAEGYIIYFVSDRPEGLGGLDIWQSKRSAMGAYSEPVNVGPIINTIDDDITPFFHNTTQSLYFSSKGHHGFGGFDIFKSDATNFTYYEIENIGHLINSTFNDQYAVANSDASEIIFSSNRPEYNKLIDQTCCYDLFLFNFKDTILEIEEIDTNVISVASNDTIPVIDEFKDLSSFEAIKLFFHNDEPDKNTWNTVTEQTYLQTYYAYLKLKNDYDKNYSLNNKELSKDKASKSINDFFAYEVQGGFERLEQFSERILVELEKEIKIKVMVRGHTSPLAASDYNLNLSKRRISSLLNHITDYKEGIFQSHLESGQLIIEEEPAGELYVLPGVSDELDDITNSIYSPEAARERRIEITRVIISN